MKLEILKYKATFFKTDGDKDHNLGSLTFLEEAGSGVCLTGRAFRLASPQQLEANRVKMEII